MFDQQKYINSYIKDNYKSYKIRVRKDNKLVLQKLSEVENVNRYILSLILEDIYRNRVYHYINNEVVIDFPLSKTLRDLVDRAEIADILDDYGTYMNMVYGIDSRAKTEVTHHRMRESQWNKLLRRYQL